MTMVKMLVVFVDRYETDGENGEDGDYTNGSTMIFSSHQIRNNDNIDNIENVDNIDNIDNTNLHKSLSFINFFAKITLDGVCVCGKGVAVKKNKLGVCGPIVLVYHTCHRPPH